MCVRKDVLCQNERPAKSTGFSHTFLVSFAISRSFGGPLVWNKPIRLFSFSAFQWRSIICPHRCVLLVQTHQQKFPPLSREGGQSVHGFLLLSAPWRMVRWIRSWWTPLSESVHRLGTYHLEVPKKHIEIELKVWCVIILMIFFDVMFPFVVLIVLSCLWWVSHTVCFSSSAKFNHAIVLHITPNPLEVLSTKAFHLSSGVIFHEEFSHFCSGKPTFRPWPATV